MNAILDASTVSQRLGPLYREVHLQVLYPIFYSCQPAECDFDSFRVIGLGNKKKSDKKEDS